jgi:hypothetical protein
MKQVRTEFEDFLLYSKSVIGFMVIFWWGVD